MVREKFHMRSAVIASLSALSFAIILAALSLGDLRKFGVSPFISSAAATDDGDWTYVDHDFDGTRYSPLSQITPQNVNQLAKVCSYTFPEQVPSESAPIA